MKVYIRGFIGKQIMSRRDDFIEVICIYIDLNKNLN